MRRLLPFALLLLVGCATTSPRFTQDVAASFTQDMGHLVTDDVDLYYPAQHRDAALRVAARASECLTALRARSKMTRKPSRALLFLSDANWNNAGVSGQYYGEPLQSVNPLFATGEYFPTNGLGGADAGDIACHEMLHYAHFEQIEGLWRIVNLVVGPVVPSQWFVERWYMEGVAQYYEGRIRKRVGRPNTPLYQALFDSYVELRGGHLNGGDLSPIHRELAPVGGAYLVSNFFVQWLAERYGEDKLWEVMELQGKSLLSPFGVTLRFKAVYGKSVGALMDEWSEELAARPARPRRPDQHVLRDSLGHSARLASHAPSGTLALLTEGNDEPPTLRILERDGTLRLEKRLHRFDAGREWVISGPLSSSGLSFSADGRFLYLLNDDLSPLGDTTGQIWKIDALTGVVVDVRQGVGHAMGGAVHPDGRRYTLVTFAPGQSTIVDVELSTGAQTLLVPLPASTSVAALDWSPDGTRLVFSRLDAAGWNLVLREADGSTRALTSDGAFNYGARWESNHSLIFSRTFEGRAQVHRLDLASHALERLSDVPFGQSDPAPLGDTVAVINRVGTQWSLDTLPATALGTVALDPTPEPKPVEPAPPLRITSDEPYSPVDHLFIPELRAPTASLTSYLGADRKVHYGASVGLVLSGRDRLNRHAWSVSGGVTIPTLENWQQLAYTNLQLAPWAIDASAARTAFLGEVFWEGGVDASRTISTLPISFGFGTLVWQPQGQRSQQFLGPRASVSWGSVESTSYGGARRGFSLSLSAAGYPAALGSSINMADLQAAVGLVVPLPVSTRHSLVVSMVGRTLPGAPAKALRVGGIGRGTSLYTSRDRSIPTGPDVLLPGGLSEPVRGYEDYAVRATSAAIGVARYRYSLIIDRGFASTFYLLPSLFFRQLDLEAFGTVALTDNPDRHTLRAAGASVVLRTLGGSGLPISLIYQFAWRFDFGLTQLHTLALSFE